MIDRTQRIHADPGPQTGQWQPGDRILTRYRVLSVLGRGAMGVVYLCHDEVGEILVALKTISGETHRDTVEMASLRQSFRLVEGLHHPCIAGLKTLEQDPDTGAIYLIMEFVPGCDLHEYLADRGGRMELNDALPLLEQIAQALDYGHQQGIIHRDIKPANVRVKTDGSVKVLDYGIAARIQESLARLTGDPQQRTGTVAYMAPEQWKGSKQDGSTDQYALAVVAHELLTGRLPFSSTHADSLRHMVLNETPPAPPELSPGVWGALLKALAKERADRYPSCAEFVEALGRAAPSRRTGRPWLGIAAVAVAVAVGCGLFMAIRQFAGNSTSPSSRTMPPPPPSAVHSAGPLNYHAVVVGISDYGGRADHWPNLGNARHDAEAVADVLEDAYGFQVTRLFDKQASRESIIATLDGITALGAQDAVLVYYAGHGYYEQDLDEGYWIPCGARGPDSNARLPKEDWVWNSTITTLVNASGARHVLVIADSCYSGSLARGPANGSSERELAWYERAIHVPSRYLIASGNLEPVPDSGVGHSVFTKQLLNYLSYPERGVFSASDLGVSIRRQVTAMTGQHVTTTQLLMPSHAGGEFVFVQRDATDAETFASLVRGNPDPPPPEQPLRTSQPTARQSVQEALLAANQGATNGAHRILSSVARADPDHELVQAATSYLHNRRTSDRLDRISQRLERIDQALAAAPPGQSPQDARYARPRVVACLGPTPLAGASNLESLALLYRVCLIRALEEKGTLYVIERREIETLLSELGLNTSAVSDPRARLEMSRLLPASTLLLGDLLAIGSKEHLALRLVDTSSGRILKTYATDIRDEPDPLTVCQEIAEQIEEEIRRARPLVAQVWTIPDASLKTGIGSFHLAQKGMPFDLTHRVQIEQGYRETQVGTAILTTLGDVVSDIQPTWKDEDSPISHTNLWLHERISGDVEQDVQQLRGAR